MHDATDIVTRLQPRLHGIAYRMLGSVADAEDVVQDVWLRWHDTEQSAVDNPEAWLVATTTRRAIDRLRSARAAREHYVGIWLPEPILTSSVPTDAPATPEQTHARYGDLSVALLALLERLSPEARAAFLLRDVFDIDYPDIAAALGKNEAACRQIVFRARAQLQDERPRYRVDADAHRRLLERFVAAMTGGDLDGMKTLLAGTSRLLGDGGGSYPIQNASALISPTFPQGATQYSIATAKLSIGQLGTGSSWFFKPVNELLTPPITYVVFERNTHAIRVYDGATGTFVDTGVLWPDATYFEVKIIVERATKALRVCLNGATIYTGVAANAHMRLLEFGGLMEGGSNNSTLDVDDVTLDNVNTDGGCTP